MKKYVLCLLLLNTVYAGDYEIGNGVKLNQYMTLSGYFSTEYMALKHHNKFILEDMAILAYGQISPRLSYSTELEATSVYIKDFTTKQEYRNAINHIERLYFDYGYMEDHYIRVGKQITPIGYWNYEPINVLRDTTSNPIYSFTIFPKLFTGIDLYGVISSNEHINYHVFLQKNRGLSDKGLNIPSKYFMGVSLGYMFDSESQVGASLGSYERADVPNMIVDYIQANAKYIDTAYEVQTEMIYTKTEQNQKKQNNQLVGYVQGKYNLSDEHAIIARYEYIEKQTTNHLGIIGYSYRPLPPVSLKVEYQFHKNHQNDNLWMSFSVLF